MFVSTDGETWDATRDTTIVDLAPTLMHMLGRQLPGDLDGRVLESLFTPDWLAANPPNLGGGSSAQSPDGAKPFNEDEEEEPQCSCGGRPPVSTVPLGFLAFLVLAGTRRSRARG